MVEDNSRPKRLGGRTGLLVFAVLVVAFALVAVGLFMSGVLFPSRSRLILATTTSTQNSGLLDYILPGFESKYDVRVDIVAVGSGQAIELGKKGDADVVLSHAPSLEDTFMKDGYGIFRWQVMYNQFAVVGSENDPAGIKTALNATDAFTRIFANSSTFTSRSDNSGTNVKELEIWGKAGLDTSTFGSWYKKLGKGMEDTLQMSEEMDAYTLTDEGTYFSLMQTLDLKELFRNDTVLFNQYSIMPVNPDKAPNVNIKYAVLFAVWLVKPETQQTIASYSVNGHQLFFPNAEEP